MTDVKNLCRKLSLKANLMLSNKNGLDLFSKELKKSDITTSTKFNIYDNSQRNESNQSDIRGLSGIINKLDEYESFVFKDNLFWFLRENTIYIHSILERKDFDPQKIKSFGLTHDVEKINIPITTTYSGIGLSDGELFDCIRTNLFENDKIHFIISDMEKRIYLLFERSNYFYKKIYYRLCKMFECIIAEISIEDLKEIDRNYLLSELKRFTQNSKWDGVRIFGLKYAYKLQNLKTDDIINLIKDGELEETAKIELNKSINMYKELIIDELSNNVYNIKFQFKSNINELILKYNYNKIFYGVPGVGKSYRIKQTEDLFEQEKTVFHPEYTNADFVGQLLPVRRKRDNEIENGDEKQSSISYEFVPGPFTRILKKALKNQEDTNKKYMLVIDEINRGNAAAIFGEIFQLLDRDENGKSEFGISNKDIYDYLITKDKDGEGVKESFLPDGKIYLPPNLYIWATMNTSDQNVYTLDTAFQRRWQMEMLTIDFDKDDDTKAQGEIPIPNSNNKLTWREFVTAINAEISNRNEGMISVEDKRIGPWFAKKNEIEDKNLFTQKVIKYLWDDAFKMSRSDVFKDIKTLDDIVDKTNKDSTIEDIFNEKIFEKVIKDRKESPKEDKESNAENENRRN